MSRQDSQTAQTTETQTTETETTEIESRSGEIAVIAARADRPPVETDELRALADAAGYDVRAEVTQVRPEDPGTYFGDGKVDEIVDRAAATGASLVVVDDQLTPQQTVTIRERLPDGAGVFDRYRLVLAIFGDQAETKRAQLQVELARLKYDLPRLKERSDVQGLNKYAEKGTPLDGVQNRIADLERKLADLPNPGEQHRERRREQGFDLVSFAGYTNAGKSTLLHRLADDLDLAETGPDHPDEDATAAVEDRLFKTLETTTRRATLAGRPVLCTDTVGFVDDLPHWLVESFSETLSDAAAADVVVLVADASDPLAELRRKLDVALDVLGAQGVDEADVVTALNKVDLLDDDAVRERVAVAADVAPASVPVSVREGTNVSDLVEAVTERLPTERTTVEMPNCDDAMAVVSRAYDRAEVEAVDYESETVQLTVAGRPDVVARLEADAADVAAQ